MGNDCSTAETAQPKRKVLVPADREQKEEAEKAALAADLDKMRLKATVFLSLRCPCAVALWGLDPPFVHSSSCRRAQLLIARMPNCLPDICLSMYLSIWVSGCLGVWLSGCLVCLVVWLSGCLVCLVVWLSGWLSICRSIYLSVCLSG